ncbi:DUF4405 domain-containing protein [Magnetospirillum sulfuroxidans]|uniref:DUF4405 domain-containing protein n=1 Tax=Magnetospirillum sulfuroxidans TaxID=611300 RepID=A0ABS5IEU9_9PROT|nr:DUF4405 domain-containing protein [Magnetospirillum sulfuroxidans]MBR9972258.1 DUF4405 domain-containing protein [Magnetospirillum sulfuroxidans]
MTGILWRKHITAATAALFSVVGLSGTLIFFHLGESLLKGLHEWLGLGFVVLAGLHVWRNGPAFIKLMTKPATHAAFALAVVAAGGFMLASGGEDSGNPMRRFVQAAENAPLSALAPVIGISEPVLVERLTQAGVPVSAMTISLKQLSDHSGMPVPALLNAAVTTKK